MRCAAWFELEFEDFNDDVSSSEDGGWLVVSRVSGIALAVSGTVSPLGRRQILLGGLTVQSMVIMTWEEKKSW